MLLSLPNSSSVVLAASLLVGLPASWTVVARNEYHHHTLQRLLGSKKAAAYSLAGAIFMISLWRDAAFINAIEKNPIPIIPEDEEENSSSIHFSNQRNEHVDDGKKNNNSGHAEKGEKNLSKKCPCSRYSSLQRIADMRKGLVRLLGGSKRVIKGMRWASYLLMGVSTTLVLSSTAKLGITGTYLGDYCGILKDEIVTGFPFNILNNPMYTGGAGNFFALALRANNALGVGLAVLSAMVYVVVSKLEGPFTAMIYANR